MDDAPCESITEGLSHDAHIEYWSKTTDAPIDTHIHSSLVSHIENDAHKASHSEVKNCVYKPCLYENILIDNTLIESLM